MDQVENQDNAVDEEEQFQIDEIIETGKDGKDSINEMLYKHLVLWKRSGVPAPVNELQSIQGWLRHLGDYGLEKTKSAMRKRMVLLQNASVDLFKKGPSEEDKVGIYKNISREEFTTALNNLPEVEFYNPNHAANKVMFTVAGCFVTMYSKVYYYIKIVNNKTKEEIKVAYSEDKISTVISTDGWFEFLNAGTEITPISSDVNQEAADLIQKHLLSEDKRQSGRTSKFIQQAIAYSFNDYSTITWLVCRNETSRIAISNMIFDNKENLHVPTNLQVVTLDQMRKEHPTVDLMKSRNVFIDNDALHSLIFDIVKHLKKLED